MNKQMCPSSKGWAECDIPSGQFMGVGKDKKVSGKLLAVREMGQDGLGGFDPVILGFFEEGDGA